MDVRKLYDTVFRDDPMLVDHQMKEVFDEIMTIDDDEGTVTMLSVTKKVMRILGKVVEVPFVIGVATREDMRGKGYMRRLFDEFFERYAHYPVAILAPVNPDYYTGLGFTKMVGRGEVMLDGEEDIALTPITEDTLMRYGSRADVTEIISDRESAERRILGYRLDSREAYTLTDGDVIGYVVLDGETVVEYSDMDIVSRAKRFKGMRAITKRNTDDGVGAMWRIMNPVAFFEGMACSHDIDWTFTLGDKGVSYRLYSCEGLLRVEESTHRGVELSTASLTRELYREDSPLGKLLDGATVEFFAEYL